MRFGARRAALIATTTLVSLLTAGAVDVRSARAVQDEYDDEVPMPCPLNMMTSGFHQQKTWPNVGWAMYGPPVATDVANYFSQGNQPSGITLDVTEEWQWVTPRAQFKCAKIYLLPPLPPVIRFHALWTSGEVVAYGEEEATEESAYTDSPSGGVGDGDPVDQPPDEPGWYICYYWRYPDGTHSLNYHRCEPL